MKSLHLVFLLCSSLLFTLPAVGQPLSVTDLKYGYQTNPLGTDSESPAFSWKIRSSARNVLQSAYQIKLYTGEGASRSLIWDSEKQSGDQSAFVSYTGSPLKATTRYYWQVRIWDTKNKASAWSPMNFFETGFLKKESWPAKWIATQQNRDKGEKSSPMFRKTFSLGRNVRSARLYITAHGLYEASINGARVGNKYFAPGWTSYHKRLQYQVYDITQMLKSGNNAIGVVLGEGWYAGRLMAAGNHYYGDQLALLAQIEVQYDNGNSERIITDESWKATTNGPILRSEIYDGEIYDARKEIAGWQLPGFDDKAWLQVRVNPSARYDNLVPTISPLVEKHETLKAKKLIVTPRGERVIDFGQNLTGWVKFKVNGKAGDSIRISHAEVLDKEGNFYTENLRSAKQRIQYHLKGGSEELYEPHFTFQGFRYVRIEGNKELIDLNNIEAIVLHSAMENTGKFNTSNALLNQLQHNILWGQKSNFLDVPTDCPQRDEREGWTGDAQVFFNTAAFNMDVSGFFAKWLSDLKVDQHPDGAVPQVIPNVWGNGERDKGSAGWADAATIIPWNFYLAYGNKAILENQYNSMKAWAAYVEGKSTNYLWNKSWHHGDWLYYMPNNVWDHDPALTDKTLIAQAFYACTLGNIIQAARVLNKPDDAARYTELLEKVKKAFQDEFMTKNGSLVSNTQTAYTLALQFDLLPEEYRKTAAEKLVANIRNYNNHISTGFLGTPYLCHVLSKYGYDDVAFTLLMQESYPSWLYPVKMGATTIWERWDGIRPDGTFQSRDMNSFNHYAYGAIGDWMYKNIAGIRQRDGVAAYKEFEIGPKVGGGLTSADAELETVYGKISSSWKLSGDDMIMEIEVPANTTAYITFPSIKKGTLTESGKKIQLAAHASSLKTGSGKYSFKYQRDK